MQALEVLKAILYFSIFKHPITKKEVIDFSTTDNHQDLDQQLEYLTQEGVIYKLDDYYASNNDLSLVERRLKGYEMAKKIMPKAKRVARLITKFPYIESVSLSGALSKGYFDKDGDIDFFIITKPNKLSRDGWRGFFPRHSPINTPVSFPPRFFMTINNKIFIPVKPRAVWF